MPTESDENTKGQSFVCDRCGICCRSHRVPVTGSDLKTLEDGLRHLNLQSLRASVEFLSPEEVDMVGEPESLALLREGRKVLVLKHSAANDKGQTGCVFLSEGGSCELHSYRPLSCRSYPFDRPNPGEDTALGTHPAHLCPPETLVRKTQEADPVKEATAGEYLRAVLRRDAEAKEHAAWIQEWNRRQRVLLRLGRAPREEALFLSALLAASRVRSNE